MKKIEFKQVKKYLVPGIAVIGLVVLFFFPEPETNFLLYLGTGLFFISLILFLIWKK